MSAPGRRGAGAALRRLEEQGERGYARLQLALERGDPIAIDAAQTYWLRISFAVFLSSETLPLMGLRFPGEFKYYAFERFRSILHLTVLNSLKTNSPIPEWAASKVTESWNIPTLDADGN